MKIEKLVFWSGIYNVTLVIACISPKIYLDIFGLNFESPIMAKIISVVLIFTVAVLIISSRNLKSYAPIVYWEGIVRVLAGIILIPAGFLGSLGIFAGILGIVDVIWALIYFFGLTKKFNVSHWDLIAGKVIN